MTKITKHKGYGKLLLEGPFMEMFADFSNWRNDDFNRLMERNREAGRVLPFIRGLRLSSHLIYIIRSLLSGSNLTASWGHILDNDDDFAFCSRESD